MQQEFPSRTIDITGNPLKSGPDTLLTMDLGDGRGQIAMLVKEWYALGKAAHTIGLSDAETKGAL